jgi:hypothetical protein
MFTHSSFTDKSPCSVSHFVGRSTGRGQREGKAHTALLNLEKLSAKIFAVFESFVYGMLQTRSFEIGKYHELFPA